jgi:glycosyltransferase involved in cell wall biosynthesis
MTAASPEVSVVMSVYDSASTLDRALDSILGQQEVELEFIVVDDGSSDGSSGLLDRRAAQDPRLVVIHQQNAGLTRALATGCDKARGRFIARQDAGGDISLPGRLRHQLDFMKCHPDAVMVSCGTRFVGPDDATLFQVVLDDAQLAEGLSTLRIPGVRGPSSHPSTMFLREAYVRVGGYRPQFVVSQDMDLWLRLFEVGQCLTMPEVYYQARHSLGSISSRFGERQLQFGAIAVECAARRRRGEAEPELPLAGESWSVVERDTNSGEAANLHYFLGSCLRGHDRSRARKHFLSALRANPLHYKAALRMIETWLR